MRCRDRSFIVWAFAGFAAAMAALASSAAAQGWQRVEDARYGFMIAYPGELFAPRKASENGHVFVSPDGRAQLLVGAFENEDGTTLAEYRAQILAENYAGAEIDFAKMKRRWFIVSGTRGNLHFYERVHFTCGGRLINSWALLYPASERRLYDRVVEAIAPTFTPGAGPTGNCE